MLNNIYYAGATSSAIQEISEAKEAKFAMKIGETATTMVEGTFVARYCKSINL